MVQIHVCRQTVVAAMNTLNSRQTLGDIVMNLFSCLSLIDAPAKCSYLQRLLIPTCEHNLTGLVSGQDSFQGESGNEAGTSTKQSCSGSSLKHWCVCNALCNVGTSLIPRPSCVPACEGLGTRHVGTGMRPGTIGD